ncbi:MAG: helix-turn-helix domain-containing protein [Deltaproteobacteria bacterium]|jgi:cytoskeletal protein RodZ|nr:MAG: helix-turn-helix domain-containing protein [Deltaproteobacteria bacterium]
MESIGDYLKRERELRNITLEEVANGTKINIGILRTIEEGQTERFPAEVFVRGFIRCYAQYIGLDTNDVLLRYHPQTTSPEHQEEISPPPEKKIWLFFSRHRKLLKISISIIIVVFLLSLVVNIGKKEPLKKEQPPLSKSYAPAHSRPVEANRVVDQAQTYAPEQTNIPDPQAKAPEAPQLQDITPQRIYEKQHELRAVFKENTWVQSVIDEQNLQEYSFKAGETITWTMDNKIRLIIGNAGGMDLYLDGEQLKSLGDSGQVVDITLPLPTPKVM